MPQPTRRTTVMGHMTRLCRAPTWLPSEPRQTEKGEESHRPAHVGLAECRSPPTLETDPTVIGHMTCLCRAMVQWHGNLHQKGKDQQTCACGTMLMKHRNRSDHVWSHDLSAENVGANPVWAEGWGGWENKNATIVAEGRTRSPEVSPTVPGSFV